MQRERMFLGARLGGFSEKNEHRERSYNLERGLKFLGFEVGKAFYGCGICGDVWEEIRPRHKGTKAQRGDEGSKFSKVGTISRERK